MKHIIQKVSEFEGKTCFKVKHEDFDFTAHIQVGNALIHHPKELNLYLSSVYDELLHRALKNKKP